MLNKRSSRGKPVKLAKPLKKGDPLTVRECEVALALTEGLSNKLIAAKLDITEHTAKFHINNARLKLGGQTRSDTAVIYARRLDQQRLDDEHTSKKTHHPMQPVVLDADGTVRFKANRVVRWMYEQLKQRGLSLNEIYAAHDVESEDRDDYQHLMQLIGYSVDGYGELSTSDPEIVQVADRLAAKLRHM
jgi:DNA-binding CsgD family transcriptional regulator